MSLSLLSEGVITSSEAFGLSVIRQAKKCDADAAKHGRALYHTIYRSSQTARSGYDPFGNNGGCSGAGLDRIPQDKVRRSIFRGVHIP